MCSSRYYPNQDRDQQIKSFESIRKSRFSALFPDAKI